MTSPSRGRKGTAWGLHDPLTHWLSGWPKKSPNFFFTTKVVFPKSLKFMNSGNELNMVNHDPVILGNDQPFFKGSNSGDSWTSGRHSELRAEVTRLHAFLRVRVRLRCRVARVTMEMCVRAQQLLETNPGPQKEKTVGPPFFFFSPRPGLSDPG